MRQSMRIANLQAPTTEGSRMLPLDLVFTSALLTIPGDLVQEIASGALDFVQSLWIDNSRNPSVFTFQILGIGNYGQTISVRPYGQGYYQVTPEYGDGFRFVAVSGAAVPVPVILYNIPMPYNSWVTQPGSIPGTGGLVMAPLNVRPLIVGDNVLIGGVAGKSIYAYRLLFDVDAATNIQFFDGASAGAKPLTGLMTLFAGGSFNLPTDLSAWLVTSAGNGLVMTSAVAANLGGIIGYVQA